MVSRRYSNQPTQQAFGLAQHPARTSPTGQSRMVEMWGGTREAHPGRYIDAAIVATASGEPGFAPQTFSPGLHHSPSLRPEGSDRPPPPDRATPPHSVAFTRQRRLQKTASPSHDSVAFTRQATELLAVQGPPGFRVAEGGSKSAAEVTANALPARAWQ